LTAGKDRREDVIGIILPPILNLMIMAAAFAFKKHQPNTIRMLQYGTDGVFVAKSYADKDIKKLYGEYKRCYD
jgi:hypothetical protein